MATRSLVSYMTLARAQRGQLVNCVQREGVTDGEPIPTAMIGNKLETPSMRP